jgi:hypothetical protein
MFHGSSFAYWGDLCWFMYGPGQMAIVYSIGSARALLGAGRTREPVDDGFVGNLSQT